LGAAWHAAQGRHSRAQRPTGDHSALNARTSELVELVRESSRQDDSIAFIMQFGTVRPDVPKLLI
jgi:hypothetical protein